MKKLTVTLVLMLGLNFSMASPAAEKSTPVSAAQVKEITHLSYHRQDGLGLFFRADDAAFLNPVMTDNPLYPLLVILSPEAAGIIQSIEYLRHLRGLTEAKQPSLLADLIVDGQQFHRLYPTDRPKIFKPTHCLQS